MSKWHMDKRQTKKEEVQKKKDLVRIEFLGERMVKFKKTEEAKERNFKDEIT